VPLEVHGFGSNRTESIDIDISQKDDSTIRLSYTIIQSFNEPSRGIFLSLPNNQNGVWTGYSLIEAVRSQEPIEQDQFDNELIADRSFSTQNAKVSTILEWNQFRIRLGDENIFLAQGNYYYSIVIDAQISADYEYNFTVLRDWVDPVDSLSVTFNDESVCEDSVCSQNLTQLTLNEGSSQTHAGHALFASTWPYIPLVIILLFVGYISWYYLARDPHLVSGKVAPTFDIPDYKPWEVAYLINDGNISIKHTLLSYILWLNNKKYISLKPDGDPYDKKTEVILSKKKKLPTNIMPSIFNTAVTKSIDKGIKKGIYASKINESHVTQLRTRIAQKYAHLFTHKPLGGSTQAGIIVGFGFVIVFSLIIVFNLLQSTILLGNSFVGLFIFFGVGLFLIICITIINWSKPTYEGAQVINELRGYQYYLEYAEKLKLDFSNNPDEGVQYYLKSVPFAAAFGILPKFQKYFAQLFPNNADTSTNTALLANFSRATFYTPPSSSSGGFSGGSSGGFSGGGGSW
jgi:uncharacterized membrane protein YgcG